MNTKPSKDIEIQLISAKSNIDSPTKPPPNKQKIFASFYNAEQIPPNFPLAENHGKAYRLYKPQVIEENTLDESGICPCCRMPIQGEPHPLNCEIDVFYKTGSYRMGSGYALYFTFLKYCVGLILVVLLFSGIYNMFTNLVKGTCDYCEGGFATFLSLANKKDNRGLLDAQLYLNLITILAMMVFLQFFRYKLRKVGVQVEKGVISPSSYTLKVTRLPPIVTDQEIKDWFEAFSSARFPIKCLNIIRTYDIKELFRLEEKKEELAMHYNNKAGKDKQNALREELVEIKEQIMDKLHKKDSQQTTTVFVTFEKPSMVAFLLKMLKPEGMLNMFSRFNPFSEQLLVMYGHKIDISKAPEPSDVMWESLGYNGIEKIKHRVKTNLIALVMLAAGCGVIIGFSIGKREIKNSLNSDSNFLVVLSFILSLFIVAVNVVLSVIIRKLTLSEKHGTKTGFATAIAQKQTIALLFNTAFTPFIVEIITTQNITVYIDAATSINAVNVYGQGGLIANIFFIFLMDGLYTPLFNIFDPDYLFKLVMRKKALKQGDSAAMTQGSANLLFEAPQPDMSAKYAFLIKTMLLTSFYAPALPTALVISIIVVILTYWTDKYAFLRRNPLPPAMNSSLSNAMMGYLEWMPFTFSIGNIIFMATLVQSNGELAYDENNQGVILATIFVSLLSIFVPMKLVNSVIFKIKGEDVEDIPYNEAKSNFIGDYETQNPIARHKALDMLPYKFK